RASAGAANGRGGPPRVAGAGGGPAHGARPAGDRGGGRPRAGRDRRGPVLGTGAGPRRLSRVGAGRAARRQVRDRRRGHRPLHCGRAAARLRRQRGAPGALMGPVVVAIARNTARELLRSKLLYNVLVFAALFIAGSLLVAQLTVGNWVRVIVDMGLSAMELAGALIAVVIGVGIVAGEVQRKTILPTL